MTIKEAIDLIKKMELEKDGGMINPNLLDSRTTNSTTEVRNIFYFLKEFIFEI